MRINSSMLKGEDFQLIEEGHITIEDGIIQEVNEGFASDGEDYKDFLVTPSLVNAHTHVGDSFAKEAVLGLSVEDAVGKNGLKWQLYRESRRKVRVDAIRDTLKYMISSGTTCFADFREFGWEGVEELEEALDDVPLKAVILGRNLPIDEVDGLGLNLHETDQIPKDRNGRIIALHAGEKEGEVSRALENDPDIIVHCTNATDSDIREIARKHISVVICPRSNAALRAGLPRVREMLDSGVNLCLGTDNVMVNSPNLLREMEFLSKTSYLTGKIPPKDIFRMTTVNPSKIFGLNSGCILKGKKADLLFINKNAPNLKDNMNPLAAIVHRCEPENIRKVMVEGRFVVDKN